MFFVSVQNSKVVEPHQPAPLISSGTAPASAIAVTPLACIDCLVIVVFKVSLQMSNELRMQGDIGPNPKLWMEREKVLCDLSGVTLHDWTWVGGI